MQTYWFKNTLPRPQKGPNSGLKSTLSRPQRVRILCSVTSMTLIGESVARTLFRTSCLQRFP
jgi:hypothetical protein